MATPSIPNQQLPNHQDAVISYLLLRQLIGVLGLSLPFVLPIGCYLFSNKCLFQPSISHYYYTIMHIVFVGTLCVLGAFLISYRGTTQGKLGRLENRVSNFAGAFAFGVAVFPTVPDSVIEKEGSCCQFIHLTTPTPIPAYIGWIHFGCATLLFGCFVLFCWKIFQESDLNQSFDYKKARRNRVYKICGAIILISILSIAGIALYETITHTNIFPYHVFIFETTALLPFGFSWLLKGSLMWPHSKNTMVRKMIQYFR